MRRLKWAAIAFVVGFVLAGLSVYADSPLDQTVRSFAGSEALVTLRVENIGDKDLRAELRVEKERGDELYATSRTVPAGSPIETTLTGRLRGDFLAFGAFEVVGGTARGDYIQKFSSAQCPQGHAIVVIFRVDTTNGIAFPDGDESDCRAR